MLVHEPSAATASATARSGAAQPDTAGLESLVTAWQTWSEAAGPAPETEATGSECGGPLPPYQAFEHVKESVVEYLEAAYPIGYPDVVAERAMRAYSCQIQPVSEAVLAHWALSDPYIQAVIETCALERVTVYGRPNDAVLARLQALPQREIPRSR